MADGATHKKYLRLFWYVIIPIAVAVGAYESVRGESGWLYFFFIIINYWFCEVIDPDADQLSLTIAEGTVLRITRRFYLGFFGALFVSYSFLYAYIIGLFGGHRSMASHGWIVGTIGRMIFYNLPIFIVFNFLYIYGISYGWWTAGGFFEFFRFKSWLYPYLKCQFLAWFIGDATHLILDMEWTKGILYQHLSKRKNT